VIITLVAVVLAVTTFAAAVTPARRAGLLDPLLALRAE
jgi:ABC-type lipoprotein release transport system permease subunit